MLKKNKLAALVLSAVTAATMGGMTAFADTLNASVQQGSLTFTTSITNNNITVTPGGYQDFSPGGVTVNDYRGTLGGWHVTLQVSQLTEVTPPGGFAQGTQAIVLPKGTIKASCGYQGNWCSQLPGLSVGSDFPASGAYITIDDNQVHTLYSMAPGYGGGTVGVLALPRFNIQVPANTKTVDDVNYPNQATPYSATITVSVVAGP